MDQQNNWGNKEVERRKKEVSEIRMTNRAVALSYLLIAIILIIKMIIELSYFSLSTKDAVNNPSLK